MPDTSPPRESASDTRWRRFSAEAVRVFHLYANWLVGITWKRFTVLSVLLLILAAILSHLPPFSWKWTEEFEREPAIVLTPPKPPLPPSAPTAQPAKPAKPGAASPDEDIPIITIDRNGVRITPRWAAAASAAEAASGVASAASSASGAASSPVLAGRVITIPLPAPAREAVEDIIRNSEEARRDAEAARREAEDARREAEQELAQVQRDADSKVRKSRRTVVVSGDFLTNLAFLFIIASAIVKATYKGRIQAEVKAAAATETAESEQLKRQVVEARMAAMQAQVEPHFLFNTLASIDHLIETDPARASQMQKNLIALLRASMPTMREARPMAHNLGREMAVIRPYLAILKVRMEDRLHTVIDVPEGLLSADFPSMMIQSLVENAIKHGLEPKAEGGTLTVRAEILHGKLAVTVADTGLGFGKAATAGTGIGLANIRERLQLLYGSKASMVVAENPPSGTLVTLTVPYLAQAHEGGAA